jgi:predicted esterase
MTPIRSSIVRLAVVTTLVCGSLSATEPGADHPRSGDFKDDYRNPATNALIMHYRMIVPKRLPEKKTLGLVVAFHGLNGNEDHMTGFAHRAARRVDIADQYVIIGGKSQGKGWAESDDDEVLAWIEWVLSTYPIDRRRVHIIGMSNGGWMVKRFGWAHQDLFASVSPYCGAGSGISGSSGGGKRSSRGRKSTPAETRTEWYIVHGDADKVVSVESSRLAVKQLAQRGYRYVYREIDGADHGGVLRYPDVAADNFRFIHALRNKEIVLSRAERKALAASQKKLKKESADTALPRIAEIARLGGPAGASAIRSALRNSDPAVRKAAIEVAGSVLFGRGVALELIRLTKDKSSEIRSAAFEALSALANWRVPVAQAFLIQAARKRSLKIEDRSAAVKGLAHTAKLMFLGWYEDKDVLWTLVFLLGDKEASIRETAFAALEAGAKETFGYEPDLDPKERRAAATKWAAWCEKQAGRPR